VGGPELAGCVARIRADPLLIVTVPIVTVTDTKTDIIETVVGQSYRAVWLLPPQGALLTLVVARWVTLAPGFSVLFWGRHGIWFEIVARITRSFSDKVL